MTLAGRIGRAILWGQAGRLMEAAILFFFSLLLARILGPASYGLYALGISLAGVCGFLSLLGLGPETLGRFLPEIAKNGQQHRTGQLLRSLFAIRAAAIVVVACVAFELRNLIAVRLHFSLFATSLAVVLVVFAARSVLDLFTCFSSGLLDLRRVAFAKLAAAAITPASFLLLFTFGRAGVNGAWLSIAAGSLVAIVILAFPLPSTQAATTALEPLPLRRILAFGLFTWAANFFVYVLGDSTDVLLLGWLTPDHSAIGRYALAARIVFGSTSVLIGWASLVSVASLSEAYQRSGVGGIALAVEAQWKLGALSLIAPLFFLIRYAREIVTTLFSAQYASSSLIVQILSILVVCSALCGFSIHGGVLYAVGRERLACTVVGAAAIFNILYEIFLVSKIGATGAAWATGSSCVLLALLCTAASSCYVPLRVPVTFLLKIVTAATFGLVCTAWAAPVSRLALGGAAILYSLGFFACLALLKPLSATDSASLHRVNNMLGCYAERFFTTAYAASASGNQ